MPRPSPRTNWTRTARPQQAHGGRHAVGVGEFEGAAANLLPAAGAARALVQSAAELKGQADLNVLEYLEARAPRPPYNPDAPPSPRTANSPLAHAAAACASGLFGARSAGADLLLSRESIRTRLPLPVRSGRTSLSPGTNRPVPCLTRARRQARRAWARADARQRLELLAP